MKVNLASGSPRRQQLLQQIGVDYELVVAEIDEFWDGREAVRDYVMRMALEKGRAAIPRVSNGLPVLAADTCVVLDDMILGKAENEQDASDMLGRLSGRRHYIYTAVALLTDIEALALSVSKVSFRPLSGGEIQRYCATGEPFGKAGGYAIQGRAAAFIRRLEGSYSGVMGLPLFELAEMLRDLQGA